MIAKYMVVILLSIIMLTACNEGAPHNDAGSADAETFTRYGNDDFTVLYPRTLTEEPTKSAENRVSFVSGASEQRIGERFDIAVQEFETEAPSVDQLTSYSIQKMDDLLSLSIERKDGYMFPTATSSGVRALLHYQEYDDLQTGERYVLHNLLVPLESKLYILSYTCSKEVYESIKNTVVAKVTESIRLKNMPVSNWNTADPDIDTNGNEALAIKELTTFRSLNNGEPASPADLFEAPQKYYGKAVTVKGKIEYIDSFEPIGGIRSEIVIETSDGTLVDVLGMNKAKDGLKVGHRTTLTGLPIGKGEVADSEGVMQTYVFLVAK